MGLRGERKNNGVKEVLLKISQSFHRKGREKSKIWFGDGTEKRETKSNGGNKIGCTGSFYSLPRTDIMDPRLISIIDLSFMEY